jgi:hypothetical protein
MIETQLPSPSITRSDQILSTQVHCSRPIVAALRIRARSATWAGSNCSFHAHSDVRRSCHVLSDDEFGGMSNSFRYAMSPATVILAMTSASSGLRPLPSTARAAAHESRPRREHSNHLSHGKPPACTKSVPTPSVPPNVCHGCTA